jgi:DNA-binding response OmpR family regulator
MTAIRILHVDDEPDIREVVELALGLDPGFETRSCCCGNDALGVAADWRPDIILLDVMMPGMDGPTTLAHLRKHASTARFPVAFMTARAQARDMESLRSLGAVGVIAKPFDPMTLAASVRGLVPRSRSPLDELRENFLQRVRRDAMKLAESRAAFVNDAGSPATLERIKQIAHALSGAGGIYGFIELSEAAAAVEDAAIAELAEPGLENGLLGALDDLIAHAERCDGASRIGRA